MDLTAALGRAFWSRRTAWIARPANDIAASALDLRRSGGHRHAIATQLLRPLIRRADAVIAQSGPIANGLKEWGVDPNRVAVVPNGIEAPATPGLGFRAWPPVRFLAVGRLTYQKGFDLLVDALAAAQLPAGWSLRVCGTGPDLEALEAQSARLALPVRFVGHVSDIDREYANADVLLAPSRYEGFSNVVLEALAHGIPVLANAGVGGVEESVVDGVNGWVSQEITVESLQIALRRMVTEPLTLDSQGIAQDVLGRLSIRSVAQRYLDVVATAVNLRRGRPGAQPGSREP